MRATEEVRDLLGDLYNYDDRNVVTAMLDAVKKCDYVEGLDGVQFWKK